MAPSPTWCQRPPVYPPLGRLMGSTQGWAGQRVRGFGVPTPGSLAAMAPGPCDGARWVHQAWHEHPHQPARMGMSNLLHCQGGLQERAGAGPLGCEGSCIPSVAPPRPGQRWHRPSKLSNGWDHSLVMQGGDQQLIAADGESKEEPPTGWKKAEARPSPSSPGGAQPPRHPHHHLG